MESNESIAIEFLLWSYFNLYKEDTKENIINSCIKRAYSDATNQGAYNTRKTVNVEYNPELISSCIENLDGDYDTWHINSCKYIVENFGNKEFTYGNAQKWLNMTVKYFFIVNAIMKMLNASKDFREFYKEKFEKHESQLHVPIDSYIIESLWGESAAEYLPITKTNKDGKLGAYSSDKYTPWSKFNENDYSKLQDYIQKNLGEKTPIEWENEKWISATKQRNKKKK